MNPTGAQIASIRDTRTTTSQTSGCPEWETAGIRAALQATKGEPADVMAAAHLAAGDPKLRFPSEAGFRQHWPKNATAAPRQTYDVPCPEHGLTMPCPACKARDEADALTPEGIAAAKRRCLEEAAANPYVPAAVRRAQALKNQEQDA